MARVVVATVKPWNVVHYRRWAAATSHESRVIESPEDLTAAALGDFSPDYVFFPHWSWRIPREVHERFECVAFHMTDLPFGRGGSPLQNLIVRGITETKLSAFRVTEGLDAGPVYLKRPLTLDGAAREIYERAAALVFAMIEEILATRPRPVAQEGRVVTFARRTPADSEIPDGLEPERLYDFIRMLDAETYPPAFLVRDGLRYEFTNASLRDGRVVATVTVVAEKDMA